MSRTTFWTVWLLVGSFTMSVFGILMVLFIRTNLFSGLTQEIDRTFWLGAQVGASAVQYQKWAYGVWGATVAGFGLLAGLIAGNAFARREKWARNALAASVALWYLLDTGVSLASGVWVNAVFNSVVLVWFALPLAFTWREFRQVGVPRGQSIAGA
jgi:hypothetical protein